MLGLLKPTDPSWTDAVEGNLDQLLSDHAHCELKAALSALSLIGRYASEAPELVEPLTALAQEEAEHLRLVHEQLATCGARMGAPASDDYVVALHRATKPDRDTVPALLDRLLVAALIEARSCERFRLLSERLRSMELRTFYRDLMASEARHYRLFSDLASARFGVEGARARFAVLASREADIAEQLPLGPTVHG